MNSADKLAIAARNKSNYLKAKAAFNAKDIAACIQYYSIDHQIMSRKAPKGRHEIEQFFAGNARGLERSSGNRGAGRSRR